MSPKIARMAWRKRMTSKGKLNQIRKASTIAVGGDVSDSSASLCIYSQDIDLDAVTRMVGCNPTKSHVRGDLPKPRSRFPAKTRLWSLDAPPELSFEDKIQFLISGTTNRIANWKSLAPTHNIQLRCAIFLHSWTEGFDLESSVMFEIGRRGWKFGLTLYSAEGEEVVDAFLARPSEQSSR
jgi:hypothetical protein